MESEPPTWDLLQLQQSRRLPPPPIHRCSPQAAEMRSWVPKDVGLSLLFYPTASLADPALMHPQKRRCWADGLLLLLDILGPGGLSMHPLSSAASWGGRQEGWGGSERPSR